MTRPSHLALNVVGWVMALLAGCTTLPDRAAPPQPLQRAEIARQVTISGHAGVADDESEKRTLKAVAAEGRVALLERQLGALAAKGEVDLYRGNAARLLVDGPATFAAMKAAVSAARSRVLLESYIIEDSRMADELATLLTRKAAAGVKVSMIYDAIGSIDIDADYLARLQAAGVSVCKFNPINPLERPGYWGINHRDHRKILVVDNEVAFTGGINISGVYSQGSSGRSRSRADDAVLREGWRDTDIELRGPAVDGFVQAFDASWHKQGCAGAIGDAPRPAKAAPGQRVVKVMPSTPDDTAVNPMYGALLTAIDVAQHSVHLTMAYFAPGKDIVQALCDAARRGVDVTLVLPGRSDFTLVLQAGRSYYSQLLEAGVRIHEIDRAVVHAKTVVIDGVFASVGSSNLDWRSYSSNDEINVIVLGEDFGQQLEAVFQDDLTHARAVSAGSWNDRGLRQRFMEQMGRIAERLL